MIAWFSLYCCAATIALLFNYCASVVNERWDESQKEL